MTTNTDAPLMWSPPTMNNPTIVDLSKTGGQDWWHFDDNQDVIFIGDTAHVRNAKIQTEGGHNIMVLGGEYQPTGAPTGTFAFYGAKGTVFVDGVHIDNSKSSGTDGIDISGGAQTSLVVQNSSIENVNGAFSGGQSDSGNGHADGIQVQGDLGGQVNLHNLHITTDYQGLFISPQYAIAPSKVTADHVDLHYTAGQANDGNPISYLLWTNDDPAHQVHVPWSFNEVYVQPRDGQSAIQDTVWPKAGMGAEQNGDQISWPSLGYTGHVTVGNHSSFVDSTKIGANFHDTQALTGVNAGTVATTPPAPVASTPAVSTPAAGHAPTVSDLLHEMTLDYQAIFSTTGTAQLKAIDAYEAVEQKLVALIEGHSAGAAMQHASASMSLADAQHVAQTLDHWAHH
ncbi:MAG: hypothetical protein ACM31L_06420 [Actinomycetota bacterium]